MRRVKAGHISMAISGREWKRNTTTSAAVRAPAGSLFPTLPPASSDNPPFQWECGLAIYFLSFSAVAGRNFCSTSQASDRVCQASHIGPL